MGEIGGIVFTFLAFLGVVLAVRALARAAGRRSAGMRREATERMEALFRASFPELQPHFHPARVHEFVKARIARKAPAGPATWKNPPGFPAAAEARIELDGLRDRVRLVDAAGARLADFIYEEHPEGGVLRLGKGKFTVNVKGPEPRVRYWHPERELKWTPSSWKMRSGVSEEPLASRDSSSDASSHFSSSSSSPSSTTRAAAAGAGIVAAGGAFDGGGASQGWDGAGEAAPDGGSAGVALAEEGGSGAGDSGSGGSGSDTSTATSY